MIETLYMRERERERERETLGRWGGGYTLKVAASGVRVPSCRTLDCYVVAVWNPSVLYYDLNNN